MKKLISFLCLTCLFLACKKKELNVGLPFFNSAEFTPEWITKTSKEYSKIHKISDFTLMNQNGEYITNSKFKGKIYVADFFFVSCPGICPVLQKNMGKIQEYYKNDKDVLLLSHTVMPVKDSVPVLKMYAIENGIDSKKWDLVTGDKSLIYNLARSSYFADEDFKKTQDKNQFIHTENLILVDRKGRIRGVYNGTLDLEIKRLIRHINLLKEEV